METRLRAFMWIALLVGTAFILAKLQISLTQAAAESAIGLKKSEEKVRAEMVVISRQLGVTCTECHNVQNFKSDEKKSFRVSLEHMKITQMLREKGFDGKKGPEASCYMCHRGDLRPSFKENLAEEHH